MFFFLNGNCKKKLEACKKKTEESYSDESAGDDDIEVFFSRTHVFFLSHLRYYYVLLNIGNPPKLFDLDIDTGSDLTWVPCDAPCNDPCDAPCNGCTKVTPF